MIQNQDVSDVINLAIFNGQAEVPADMSNSTSELPILNIGGTYTYTLGANYDTITIQDPVSQKRITFSGLVDASGNIHDKKIFITVSLDSDQKTEAAMIVSANSSDSLSGNVTVEDASAFMQNNYGSSAAASTGPGSSSSLGAIGSNIVNGISSAGSYIANKTASCTKLAQGFGSILCGAGDIAYQAMDFFHRVVEDQLTIDTDIFSMNTGAHNTWSVFRNIANVIFIIYLLVMIFSQITGIGISNYGIKKNLPRVIVASILLNASYYLCVVAVDLSNIIGASLKAFFDYIASGITPMPGNALINAAVGSMPTGNTALMIIGGVSFGAVIAFIATASLAQTGWGATAGMLTTGALSGLLILFVNTILVAACTLLGMYLILTLRQSLVVLMIAAAPLAILAYTLPNTKNLFNLWWRVSKGLILLYPICGFVVGIGNLASSIILSVGNSLSQFMIALIAQIGPYFMLPSLFKGTLAAVGNLNAQINGITGNIHKTTNAAVNNSVAGRILNDRAGRLGNMMKRAGDMRVEADKFAADSKEARAQVAALRSKKAERERGIISKSKFDRADAMALNRAQSTVRQTKQALANEFISQYETNDDLFCRGQCIPHLLSVWGRQ